MTAVEPYTSDAQASVASAALTIALAGTIETTIDQSRPVLNALHLSIGNPPVPPGASQSAADVDPVYLTFPWGDDAASLCTDVEAQAITVTPDADAAGWTVVAGSAPSVGTYWTLTPPSSGAPEPGSSCGFVIGNIVSVSAARLPPTLCFASCWQSAGGTADQAWAPVFWRRVPLAIAAFECSPAAPTPAAPARLRWVTTGAAGCDLGPEFDDLPPSGELAIKLEDGPRTFALTAHAPGSERTATRRLRVQLAAGWTALEHTPVVTQDGPILLRTAKGLVCLQPQDGGALESTDGRGWKRRALALPDRLVGSAGCSFGARLAVSGGIPESTATASAAFVATSADGEAWSTLTASAWPQRSWHASASFAGCLWAIGGLAATGGAVADVQRSPDGRAWTDLGAASWAPRIRPGVAAHRDALWMIGGLTSAAPSANAFSDVWRLGFDLVWEQGPPPPWTGTRAVTSLAAAGGRLYALLVPLGEESPQLWVLGPELEWEATGPVPVRTERVLGLRVAMTAFHGGVLVVSDLGAWWYRKG